MFAKYALTSAPNETIPKAKLATGHILVRKLFNFPDRAFSWPSFQFKMRSTQFPNSSPGRGESFDVLGHGFIINRNGFLKFFDRT